MAIGGTGLLLARVPAHVSVWIGALLTLVSMALMALVAAVGSIPLFLAWCLVGGVGYSFAFTGGLAVINSAAPEHHRGTTLSLLYLVRYLFQGVTAIGAGALATANGLSVAVGVVAVIIAALCVPVLVLMVFDWRYRRNRVARRRSGGRA